MSEMHVRLIDKCGPVDVFISNENHDGNDALFFSEVSVQAIPN